MLCALFPDVPCLAMTATACRANISAIIDSLGLKDCKSVIGNPDRKNIFHCKVFRHGQDLNAIQSVLIANCKRSFGTKKSTYHSVCSPTVMWICLQAFRTCSWFPTMFSCQISSDPFKQIVCAISFPTDKSD